jgi:hypothetical protein
MPNHQSGRAFAQYFTQKVVPIESVAGQRNKQIASLDLPGIGADTANQKSLVAGHQIAAAGRRNEI